MSDRIAVFNQGRIDQIGTPVEVYERPATEFVAGFVGVSNVLERDGRRFTVRPEKIRLLAAGETPAAGYETERGVIREVIYVGSVTRFRRRPRRRRGVVDGRQAEPRESLGDAAEERGRPVQLTWRPEHMYAIADGRREDRMRKVRRSISGWRPPLRWSGASRSRPPAAAGAATARSATGGPRPRLDARRDPDEGEGRRSGRTLSSGPVTRISPGPTPSRRRRAAR